MDNKSSRANWFQNKREGNGENFEIEQNKQLPLKIWKYAVICTILTSAWLYLFGDKDITIINIVCVLALIPSVLTVIAGVGLIPMSLMTKDKVSFRITPEEIHLIDKVKNSYPDIMERNNISEIFMNSAFNKAQYQPKEIHIRKVSAAEQVGSGVAEGIASILFTSSYFLAVNYLGKEIILAEKLSKEEASFLYQKVNNALTG